MPRPAQESGVTSHSLGLSSSPRMLVLSSCNSSFSDHCRGTPFTPLPGQVHVLPKCPSVCDGQSPLPSSLLDCQCTCSYDSLVAPQLLCGCTVSQSTQSQLVTASFMGKAQCCLVSSGSYSHMVDHWMVSGIVAVCEQCYWILKCLTNAGPMFGANFFCHGLLFPFLWKSISCTGQTELKTLTLWMLMSITIYLILPLCGCSYNTSGYLRWYLGELYQRG